MIHYIDVVNAVNRVNGWRDGIDEYPLECQLVQSLRIYQSRGEFNGTMKSAYECLELAGYELEPRARTVVVGKLFP
jgi:hypothetical protein